MQVVMDDEFTETATVTADARGRVAIGTVGESKHYSVSRNRHGQILLTPVVQVPEYEMWLLKNPSAMASIRRGLDDEAAGRVHDMGSFAQYADLPTDE